MTFAMEHAADRAPRPAFRSGTCSFHHKNLSPSLSSSVVANGPATTQIINHGWHRWARIKNIRVIRVIRGQSLPTSNLNAPVPPNNRIRTNAVHKSVHG